MIEIFAGFYYIICALFYIGVFSVVKKHTSWVEFTFGILTSPILAPIMAGRMLKKAAERF